ncbi:MULTISPECIES: TetR/AcrR family transcriptional regulator [unclassified Streptomyces]|uniref:TetR/AcrR family transcriptional regulator n=1 Tax=unclassified Streptomyces TaxID=2593676 RepID=UPI0037FABCDC
MTEPAAARPMRSDAVRTRKLLVGAASKAFAERGAEVSVAEIAGLAGIGKGTVFRHFPTKGDLLAAIVSEKMHALAATGERLTQAADPGPALCEFMSAAIELQVEDRAFCQVVDGVARDHAEVRRSQERVAAVTDALTDRARRDGAVRPDITGQDVMLMMSGIPQTTSRLHASQPHLWRRYLRLVFDGMRATGVPPLPGPPPGTGSADPLTPAGP